MHFNLLCVISVAAMAYAGKVWDPNDDMGEHYNTFKDECIKSIPALSEADLYKVQWNDVMSEPVLCFAKCMGEKQDIIRNDGHIDIGKFIEAPQTMKIPEPQRIHVKMCVEKIEIIRKCQDMEKIFQCVLTNAF